MNVTRTSVQSGVTRTIDLPVTQEQLDRYENGQGLCQDIFPNLSPDQREFIMTGITADEWNNLFPPEEEEDEV
jgi:hypothetical protein